MMMINLQQFNMGLLVMSILAVVVFISLFFVTAGYGQFRGKGNWGVEINNKLGWFLMESPVFFLMCLLWLGSDRRFMIAPLCFFMLFQMHYLRRSFIFPLKLKGNGKMPLSIISMGVLFNLCNAFMQGGWIFYLSPSDMYVSSWLTTPQFLIGTAVFLAGMAINIQSDRIVRNLRKPGDSNYYLPQDGFFKYVTAAHYFGEFVEWVGFALLTWSLSGAVFAVWTFANLAPRAHFIRIRYNTLFPEADVLHTKKRIIPFIY